MAKIIGSLLGLKFIFVASNFENLIHYEICLPLYLKRDFQRSNDRF